MKAQKQVFMMVRRCNYGVWRELSSEVRPTIKEGG